MNIEASKISPLQGLLAILVIISGIAYFSLPLKYCVLLITGLLVLLATIKDLKIGILLLAFSFPYIPTMLTIAYVDLILALFIIKIITDRQAIKHGPLSLWLCLFGALNLFTALFSITPLASIEAAIVVLSFLALYFVLINTVTDKRYLYLLIFVLILSATLQSLYGIYQYTAGVSTVEQNWTDTELFPELNTRVFGTLENPNILSEYLLLIIPLTFGLFWSTRDWLRKGIFLAAAAIMVLCLVLTYSRAGWLAFAFSIIVFGILRDRRILVVAGIGGIIALYIQPGFIMDRLSSIGNLGDSSTAYRVFIWKASLNIIRDFWYSGVGLGVQAFQKIYNSFYIRDGVYAMHAHNLYLQIIIETGILGLIMFFATIYKTFKYGLTAMVKTDNNISKTIIAALLVGIMGFLLQGITENSFYNFKVVFLFWFIISLTMTVSELEASIILEPQRSGEIM